MEAGGILIAVAYLFYDNVWVAVMFSPFLGFYIKNKKKGKEEVQRKQLAKQFVDACTAISFSLNVGYSIENAFVEASKELATLYGANSRIVSEFTGIVRRINNNENIENVLCEFAERSGVEDISYFAEVFKYAKRSGGDLIAIIKNTASIIRQKGEVEAQIQTVISGKKMEQRIMSIMPFGMIAYLKLTSPEMIGALYGNILGIIVMTVCLVLYTISFVMAEKIVNISV